MRASPRPERPLPKTTRTRLPRKREPKACTPRPARVLRTNRSLNLTTITGIHSHTGLLRHHNIKTYIHLKTRSPPIIRPVQQINQILAPILHTTERSNPANIHRAHTNPSQNTRHRRPLRLRTAQFASSLQPIDTKGMAHRHNVPVPLRQRHARSRESPSRLGRKPNANRLAMRRAHKTQ